MQDLNLSPIHPSQKAQKAIKQHIYQNKGVMKTQKDVISKDRGKGNL